jgi:Coenzyme PQQ synthesis protein D (PqqD)
VAYRKCDDVQEKTLGETFFLFKPGLDGFYGFSGIGREIWAAVAGGEPLDRIVSQVASAYEVDVDAARRDVDEFVRDLVGQGLIEETT